MCAVKYSVLLEVDLPIFLKFHVELLFHLPRYVLLILTSPCFSSHTGQWI